MSVISPLGFLGLRLEWAPQHVLESGVAHYDDDSFPSLHLNPLLIGQVDVKKEV